MSIWDIPGHTGPAPNQPGLGSQVAKWGANRALSAGMNAALPGSGIAAEGVKQFLPGVLGLQEGGGITAPGAMPTTPTEQAFMEQELAERQAARIAAQRAKGGRGAPWLTNLIDSAGTKMGWWNQGGDVAAKVDFYKNWKDMNPAVAEALERAKTGDIQTRNEGGNIFSASARAAEEEAAREAAMAAKNAKLAALLQKAQHKEEGGWLDKVGSYIWKNDNLKEGSWADKNWKNNEAVRRNEEMKRRQAQYKTHGGPLHGPYHPDQKKDEQVHKSHLLSLDESKANRVQVGPLAKTVSKDKDGRSQERHYHNPLQAQNKP